MNCYTTLVGGCATPLKNMSSSMGRMTSHILWKITHVPNHQPDAVQGHLGAISRTVVKLITGDRAKKYRKPTLR